MNLPQRIALGVKLGNYLLENNQEWQDVKVRACDQNPWFNQLFIDIAAKSIATQFLEQSLLENWASVYNIRQNPIDPKLVGIIMAGNIPMVGFHDFLAVFIAGHRQRIKLSSKDQVLLRHLVEKLTFWDPAIAQWVSFEENLKGCDAYIATGSNNSSRYFDYYFGKFPNIIRRNRTSVAILTGKESTEDLTGLGSDLMLYFGMGCRNVTKLFVPEGYDFVPLINALKPYNHYLDFHKYNHNYDYQLAIQIMNKKYYMNSGALIFTENEALFSPISQVHYSFYKDLGDVENVIKDNEDIQCVVGLEYVPFGESQQPGLMEYADKVDTMAFLTKL